MSVERAADGTHRIKIDVPVTIRPARVDELRRLSDLWGPKGTTSRLRHLRRYFREQADGVQRGLVADFNGNLDRPAVGPAAVHRSGHRGRTGGCVRTHPGGDAGVSAAGRGRGSGAERVSPGHPSSGRTHVTIGVDRPNETARRLYAKWGFERYHESFDLRGDLVFMRREVFETPVTAQVR